MGAGGHFANKFKKKFRIDLNWPEMIFGHPKWLPAANLKKKLKKKLCE